MKTNKNVNVVSCPPCGENVGLPTKRGAYKAFSLLSPSIGPADHFLRKGGRKGFTLIELLVVVLIIGILAAVAVPQYQIAVEKSRAKSIIPIMSAIRTAQQTYYLANGSYATSFKELDIEPPTGTSHLDNTRIVWPNGQRIDLLSNGITFYPKSASSYFLKWYYHGSLACWASTKNLDDQNICKHLTGHNHGGNESGGMYGYYF